MQPLLSNQSNISTKQTEEALKSLKVGRIILPIILGLGVVFYLVYRQFDISEFEKIRWDTLTFLLLGLTVLIYIARHLAYAWRLRVLSEKAFSWGKSIELIFIWEFASSVSPTSLGGSAVALFLLSQEKLSGAKTVSMVLYSVIVDTIFFLITIPLIYFGFGEISLRPIADNAALVGGYKYTLLLLWIFMFAYAAFFIVGILRSTIIAGFIRGLASVKILRRFRRSLLTTSKELHITSAELKNQNFGFHFQVFFTTFLAWIFRFLAIAVIILAIVHTIDPTWYNINLLYARSEMMHTITQFSPTPGGAGIAEYLFGGFYGDFIPKGIATIIALIWRLITYYPYLIIGVIIIPNWIRKVWARRTLKGNE